MTLDPVNAKVSLLDDILVLILYQSFSGVSSVAPVGKHFEQVILSSSLPTSEELTCLLGRSSNEEAVHPSKEVCSLLPSDVFFQGQLGKVL